ncbi:hypothetical protein AMK68_02375 [candidate division KD3-62 bacterium DG_56]|uniref:Uncharacterized protein n=1 Tax=candidate division KD3-62 bacterium DG_56 TaxID=1704032 RepID=A0A0S7XPF5_9BACT|nr:MAG: hypothetical protein AMK68_02375 [candidate division KD3-62 bacterium DG_56]
MRLQPRASMPDEILVQALFPAGWHMMSLPAEPVNHDPATVIDSLDPMAGLFRYVPEMLTYSSYDPDGWPGFGQMEVGVGDWMKVTRDAVIAYRGVPCHESFEIPLGCVGWTMVGCPFPNPMPVAPLGVRGADGTTVSLAEAAEAAWIQLPMAHWDPVDVG